MTKHHIIKILNKFFETENKNFYFSKKSDNGEWFNTLRVDDVAKLFDQIADAIWETQKEISNE